MATCYGEKVKRSLRFMIPFTEINSYMTDEQKVCSSRLLSENKSTVFYFQTKRLY